MMKNLPFLYRLKIQITDEYYVNMYEVLNIYVIIIFIIYS